MKRFALAAALVALAGAAHAGDFDKDKDAFLGACVTTTAGRPTVVPGVCVVALQWGHDLTVDSISSCIKAGVAYDALLNCVKNTSTLQGFR